MTELVQHAVHLHLLKGHRFLQGLDQFFCLVQGDPMAVRLLLHPDQLPVDVLFPGHQFRTHVFQGSPQSLGQLRLVVQEFLLVLQCHFIEPSLLLHPVQLKSLVSFDYKKSRNNQEAHSKLLILDDLK